MANYDFDAIVIGSGISGGWAAKELCEKGMKVLMLDRGRMVEHRKDYITEGKGPWQLAYRGNLRRRMERANRLGARAAVILGDDDISRGVAQVKNLATGEQEAVALAEIAAHLR